MSYSDLLRDRRWQKKRLKIMERDGWRCVRCHDTDNESMLQVHHKEYIRGRDPWDYADDMLETLCSNCHWNKHKDKIDWPNCCECGWPVTNEQAYGWGDGKHWCQRCVERMDGESDVR
jgi:hypothetical protein